MNESIRLQAYKPKLRASQTTKLVCRKSNEHGFSLIELMVVVVITAILMSVAIPSYQRFVVKTEQEKAWLQALILVDELARWRSKYLTYHGFLPKHSMEAVNTNCVSSQSCQSQSGGVIYLPIDSTHQNYRYRIVITNATGRESLNSVSSNWGWRMLITTNPEDKLMSLAEQYYFDSLGQRCVYQHSEMLPRMSDKDIVCL